MDFNKFVSELVNLITVNPIANIKDEDNFYTDYGFDSLDMTELCIYTEDKFAVQIDINDMLYKVRTVGDLRKYLLDLNIKKR